jgi:hypothetical protein
MIRISRLKIQNASEINLIQNKNNYKKWGIFISKLKKFKDE